MIEYVIQLLTDPAALFELVRWGGYVALVVIVFTETGLLIGFFLPGDSLLITAGLVAAAGGLDIWWLNVLLSVAAIVGDSVFVHGGVLPSHVRYGLDRINREAREWMRVGGRTAPEAVAGQTAPIWVRDYSLDPVAPRACEALGEVLSALGVRRMVVGHTVQSAGISSACDDRVYRIDVGLSSYYGNGPIQVLEIEGDRVRILSAPRGRPYVR